MSLRSSCAFLVFGCAFCGFNRGTFPDVKLENEDLKVSEFRLRVESLNPTIK